MKIYDSLTQQKSEFVPLVPGHVGMYVCGMTVYDYCHLGHARVLVAFDVITRYLRQSGYEVNYVRNITDVDDKIIRRAQENGETVEVLTDRFIAAMHEDERALGVLRPTQEPRATRYIDRMLDMIGVLEGKGAAYQGQDGDVFFAIDSFPDYGKLSKRKLEDLRAGERVSVQESKRNPLDFVLWKHAKPGEVSWPSPWGAGRPGWHIECSAMSADCLGKTFDIHGGGPDLLFPHHENEIAQSEKAHDCTFARRWMHAGPVRVNQEKMSKSLGNFFTIRDVLQKVPAEVVRYFIVSSHYRSPIDYSEASLREAQQALTRFYNGLRDIYEETGLQPAASLVDSARLDSAVTEGVSSDLDPELQGFRARFAEAMDDDFNTPAALAVLFDLVKRLNTLKTLDRVAAVALARELVRLAQPLGLLQQSPDVFLQGGLAPEGLSIDDIEALIQQRQEARASRNWAESDRIRDLLAARGIVLNDSREGTTWSRQEAPPA